MPDRVAEPVTRADRNVKEPSMHPTPDPDRPAEREFDELAGQAAGLSDASTQFAAGLTSNHPVVEHDAALARQAGALARQAAAVEALRTEDAAPRAARRARIRAAVDTARTELRDLATVLAGGATDNADLAYLLDLLGDAANPAGCLLGDVAATITAARGLVADDSDGDATCVMEECELLLTGPAAFHLERAAIALTADHAAG